LAGNIVEVRSGVLEIGDKSMRLLHEMWNAETQELSALCELSFVHMDRRERNVLSFPEPLRVAVLAQIIHDDGESLMPEGFASTPEPPYYAVIFTSQRTEADNCYEAMA
jgi:hypothetical protein